ncbi:MAG: DUF7287 family protein [Halobacteria archaeon]
MRTTGGRGGQTSVDFLIGVSIFAVTLLFVIQLASGSSVNLGADSRTGDALADRSGALLISNWSEESDLDPGMFDEDEAEDYLDGDPANSLSIPDGYSYNVTVVALEDISTEPPVPYNSDLTNGSAAVNTSSESEQTRIAYMNDTDEMVAVRVKVW